MTGVAPFGLETFECGARGEVEVESSAGSGNRGHGSVGWGWQTFVLDLHGVWVGDIDKKGIKGTYFE